MASVSRIRLVAAEQDEVEEPGLEVTGRATPVKAKG
jgi:hypothetical protein